MGGVQQWVRVVSEHACVWWWVRVPGRWRGERGQVGGVWALQRWMRVVSAHALHLCTVVGKGGGGDSEVGKIVWDPAHKEPMAIC